MAAQRHHATWGTYLTSGFDGLEDYLSNFRLWVYGHMLVHLIKNSISLFTFFATIQISFTNFICSLLSIPSRSRLIWMNSTRRGRKNRLSWNITLCTLNLLERQLHRNTRSSILSLDQEMWYTWWYKIKSVAARLCASEESTPCQLLLLSSNASSITLLKSGELISAFGIVFYESAFNSRMFV